MSEPQRDTRVSSYQRGDGTTVRSYTQRRDATSPDDAKRRATMTAWQAATAGVSVLIVIAEVTRGAAEIVWVITIIILFALNWLLNELAKPRPKAATGRKRTVTTRRVVRRRGPARRTVKRR